MSHDRHSERWIVILVDDERGQMELYKHGLELFCLHKARVKIEIISSPDDALAKMKTLECSEEPVLWIVDSMMPCFEGQEPASGEDEDCFFTGVELIRRLMAHVKRRDHGYLLMTHLRAQDVERAAVGLTVMVLEKAKCSPKTLSRVVDKIIA